VIPAEAAFSKRFIAELAEAIAEAAWRIKDQEAVTEDGEDKAIANFYITVGDKVPRRLAGKPLIHDGRKPK
jgi:hypothetical protein